MRSLKRGGRRLLGIGLLLTACLAVAPAAMASSKTGGVQAPNPFAVQAEPMQSYDGTATYYGPGLYGGTLACGGVLKRSTVAVAHKTLPCGTKIRFYYGGRSVLALVRDRGPFNSYDFDLTEHLKDKLDFPSSGKLNYVLV